MAAKATWDQSAALPLTVYPSTNLSIASFPTQGEEPIYWKNPYSLLGTEQSRGW